MSKNQSELLTIQFERAEEMTLQVVADFPMDRWFLPLAPGKAHANWLFGHMTHTLNNAVLKFCYGQDWIIGPEWGEIYGPAHRGGRTPSGDPGGYLSAEEIADWYKKSMAAVRAGLVELEDTQMTEAPRGILSENISATFATNGSLLSHIVQHDAYHRGQIVFLKTRI